MRGLKSILKKLLYVVAVLLILFIGTRFTFTRVSLNSISAGRTGIGTGNTLIRQISFGSSEKVDIFKTNEGYVTSLVNKWGPFWYKREETLSGKANSKMNVISFLNFGDPKSGSGTVLAVLSNDKNVSYLSAGPNHAKYDIQPHVMTVLSWNQSFDLISLNAVAYSEKNQPLYKVENVKITNGVATSIPIKFYPVNP